MTEEHYQRSFLLSIPTYMRSLNTETDDINMGNITHKLEVNDIESACCSAVPRPDNQSHVFVRIKEDIGTTQQIVLQPSNPLLNAGNVNLAEGAG